MPMKTIHADFQESRGIGVSLRTNFFKFFALHRIHETSQKQKTIRTPDIFHSIVGLFFQNYYCNFVYKFNYDNTRFMGN